MALRTASLEVCLAALDKELATMRLRPNSVTATALSRWRSDAAALRFHLEDRRGHLPIVAVLGGTGTGKSTLVNRLLEADLTATSYRRTFTSGPVAIVGQVASVSPEWLGVPHRVAAAEELPARGGIDELVIVPDLNELTETLTLVDTPDLDGDQPAHHVQADRVFRWCQTVLFLVSPEKYQMTELIPYYRLARRYAVPSLFVMNKCETPEMLEDYRQLIRRVHGEGSRSGVEGEAEGSSLDHSTPFAVPRDDAAFEPPQERNLLALRQSLKSLRPADGPTREAGLKRRGADLVGRLTDQVIAPLRQQRGQVEEMIAGLRGLETPTPGVDVNPITQQLQRRLQQRSVLYLMGPGRMLDRVRQVPGLLVRLPKTAWKVLMHGEAPGLGAPDGAASSQEQVPDFRVVLMEQFAIVQSRIEDVLRSHALGEQWLGGSESSYLEAKFDPAQAGDIADEELADLKQWLQRRWDATPRDTLLLQRLLKHLPGGQKLTQWSEAAPYLLVLVAAAHHLAFSGVDLLIIGGFSLATWLTEKMSNEVASRTRQTNRKINDRFTQLAHRQIERLVQWLNEQVPLPAVLDRLQQQVDRLAAEVGEE